MTIMMNKRFFWAMATAFTRWDASATDLIKVYKGTIPADADSYDPASGTYTVDELATFTNYNISPKGGATKDDPLWGSAAFTVTTGFPSPDTVNASATGTAAWYAMYNTATLTRVLLGDVTLVAGTGSMYLDTLSLTSGNPVTIMDWGMVLKT